MLFRSRASDLAAELRTLDPSHVYGVRTMSLEEQARIVGPWVTQVGIAA